MIKHLNHELIPYNESKIMGSPGNKNGEIANIALKCKKCNYIIFKYCADYDYLDKGTNKGTNFYWMYYGGCDYDEIIYLNKEWKELTLTCEEEQIKNLLE